MRYRSRICLLFLSIVFACRNDAQAEVTHSGPEGFSIDIEMTVQAPPQKVYRLLVDNIGKWWDSSHTYSGDSRNLYLDTEPKGWFGERLPDGGSVQHMEVIYAAPGKRLRLRGALGPLQEHAVTGVMTWSLEPENDATRLRFIYRVGGYHPDGLTLFAVPVERVVAAQCRRLKRLAETGQPE